MNKGNLSRRGFLQRSLAALAVQALVYRQLTSACAGNPRTGERVDVPAKLVVTFKPGLEMEQRVGQLSEVPVISVASTPP